MSNLPRKIPAVQYKKETFLNLCMLTKVHPMCRELSLLVFKENSLEKPTQNLFNQLSFYLVAIIDEQAASKFTWPLLDSRAQKIYRSELSNFIKGKNGKGLTPVMSSYFVNPGSYRVTVLIFQMSVLAVSTVISHIGNISQKKLANQINERFRNGTEVDDLMEFVERQKQDIQLKLSNHLIHRRISEEIAVKLKKTILETEKKVQIAQQYIDSLIDQYVSKFQLDSMSKEKILSLKNVHKVSPFFNDWLTFVDCQTSKLENGWNNKISPLLSLCRKTSILTEEVVKKYTGETDKNEFMISYDPRMDKICIKNLEKHFNVEQRYILQNLDINGKLNFPNLIRSFMFSISFLLKNVSIDDEIFTFNKYLQGGLNNLHELGLRLHFVMERISKAELRLEHNSSPDNLHNSSLNKYWVYSSPSLISLKASEDYTFFDSFTPLVSSRRKSNITFRQSLLTPLMPLKDDYTRSFISHNGNTNYDSYNNTTSFISQTTKNKTNETINDCSSGFTQQRLQRLLSTKKSKSVSNQPEDFKRGALNYDSGVSIESNGLTRSISSPNLYCNRGKSLIPRPCGKKLSTMKEDSPFELSGISTLNSSSNFSTPGLANAESSRNSVQSPTYIFKSIPAEDDVLQSSPWLLNSPIYPSKDGSNSYQQVGRQSLGTVLGVDHTVLDEFDLSD